MKNEKQNPSVLPDVKEIASIANKLFTDLKNSLCEITADYKAKRAEPSPKKTTPQPSTRSTKKTEESTVKTENTTRTKAKKEEHS